MTIILVVIDGEPVFEYLPDPGASSISTLTLPSHEIPNHGSVVLTESH